jgi:hypothetical protein
MVMRKMTFRVTIDEVHRLFPELANCEGHGARQRRLMELALLGMETVAETSSVHRSVVAVAPIPLKLESASQSANPGKRTVLKVGESLEDLESFGMN